MSTVLPHTRIRNALIGGAVLLAVAAGTIVYLRAWPGTNEAVLEANGQVRGTEVTVSAKVGGVAELVAVREGQSVKKGDLLVRLSSRETEAKLRQVQAQAAAAASRLAELDASIRAAGAAIEQAQLGTTLARDATFHDVHRASEALERANAEVTAAEAQWKTDRSSFRRFEQLVAQGFISQSYFDEVTSRYRSSEAKLEAARRGREEAEALLERARAGTAEIGIKQRETQRLEAERARLVAARAAAQSEQEAARARVAEVESVLADTRIVAPAGGTTMNKLVEQGELVAPGRPLATLVDLADLYVRVFIAERHIAKIRLGNPARIYADAFPGRSFAGEVTEVAQQAEFTPKEVHMQDERVKLVFGIKVRIDNPAGYLKPGIPVDVRIKWNETGSW